MTAASARAEPWRRLEPLGGGGAPRAMQPSVVHITPAAAAGALDDVVAVSLGACRRGKPAASAALGRSSQRRQLEAESLRGLEITR